MTLSAESPNVQILPGELAQLVENFQGLCRPGEDLIVARAMVRRQRDAGELIAVTIETTTINPDRWIEGVVERCLRSTGYFVESLTLERIPTGKWGRR